MMKNVILGWLITLRN